MSHWMFFTQRNMTKSCTVHVLYTAKKEKKKLYQPIGNIRLHDSQHVHGGLVQLNKNAIVDLKQTEQLKDFSDFRAHAINTAAKKKKKSSINPLQMYYLIPY